MLPVVDEVDVPVADVVVTLVDPVVVLPTVEEVVVLPTVEDVEVLVALVLLVVDGGDGFGAGVPSETIPQPPPLVQHPSISHAKLFSQHSWRLSYGISQDANAVLEIHCSPSFAYFKSPS